MVTTNNARPAPRLEKRHARYSSTARHSRSKQENEFLRVQAARLSSTSAILFGKLRKYTADQIMAASSMSNLP
jgi:hypothetical protein